MTLKEIRTQITIIDHQILKKLNQRMYLCLQTLKYKSKAKDSNRENQVLEKIKEETKSLDYVRKKFAKKIFKKIIRESRGIQKMKQEEKP
ncbi:MAG: chorismate mutase [Acidobacteriota bacterium]